MNSRVSRLPPDFFFGSINGHFSIPEAVSAYEWVDVSSISTSRIGVSSHTELPSSTIQAHWLGVNRSKSFEMIYFTISDLCRRDRTDSDSAVNYILHTPELWMSWHLALAFNSVLSLCYSLPQLTQDQNTSLYVNWVFVFFVLMIRYKTNYRKRVKLLSWRKPGWWIIETKRSSHVISFLSSTSSSRTRRLQSTFPLQFSRVSNDQKPVEFGQLAVSRGHIGLHG